MPTLTARILAAFGYTPMPAPPPTDRNALDQIDGDPAATYGGGIYAPGPDPDEILRSVNWSRADLRRLLTDEELYQCVQSRRSGMLSRPWDIEPNSGPAYESALMTLRGAILAALSGAFDALLYGYSVLELVDANGLPEVIVSDISWFSVSQDGHLLLQGKPVDTTLKFILTRHEATRANPHGDALLSRAYWPVTHRNELWRNWLQYTELFAWPLMIGKVKTPKDFVKALENQGFKAVIAVGPDDDARAEMKPTAGEFATQDAALIRRIQRLVLGQTGTSGLEGGGSYAAVEVLSRSVLGNLTDADCDMVAAAAQRVLDFARVINPSLPEFKFVWRQVKQLSPERAARDEIHNRMGIRHTEQYLLDRYDYREGDFTLEQPAAQANMSAHTHSFAQADTAQIDAAIDSAVDKVPPPLSPEQIRSVLSEATSPDDLRVRLLGLTNDPEMADTLARLAFNAELLGFESAAKEP